MTFSVQTVLLRLSLALAAGAILGIERGMKGVSAGFRTHIIVCVSSCAIMLTNLYSFFYFQAGDPMRMPAQVISGVGFLGAGSILVTKNQRIKGVTTAAGLWAAACLGLCIGAGDFVICGFVLVVECVTMTVLRVVDKQLTLKRRTIRFFAELESVSALTSFLQLLQEKDMRVQDMDLTDSKMNTGIAVVISLRLKQPERPKEVIDSLAQVEGVVYTLPL